MTWWGLTDHVARDRLFNVKPLICARQTVFNVLITNNFTGDTAEPVEYFDVLADGLLDFTPRRTSGNPSLPHFPYGRPVEPDLP